MANTILLMGAGQIGSRHLQGLKYIKTLTDIFVYDPSTASLQTAEKRWQEINTDFAGRIFFLDNMNALPEKTDLVIIATDSNARLFALELLLETVKVNFIVLEKFLFPAIKNYAYASALLNTHNITAYVNCPRRLYPHYQQIKQLLSQDEEPFNFTFEGSNFGLASNAIHSIDLFNYFLDGKGFSLDFSSINNKLLQSKRKEYLELAGKLLGVSEHGSLMNICSYIDGTAKNLVAVSNSKRRYYISEKEGYYMYANDESNWQWQKIDFTVPLQSVLSYKFADDILQNGKCDLIDYETSAQLHLQFLHGAIPVFEKLMNKKLDSCPVS